MPERTDLADHIRHSIDMLKGNLYAFVPELILTLASVIVGLLFSKLAGVDVFTKISEVILAGGDLSPYYPLFKIGTAYALVGTVFNLLVQPYLQHVYLEVTLGESVDLGKSLKDTMDRLGFNLEHGQAPEEKESMGFLFTDFSMDRNREY